MTYLELINQFWMVYQTASESLRDEEVVMYFKILDLFNTEGWTKPALPIPTSYFERKLGWSRHKIMKVRSQLKEHRLIDYWQGQGSSAPLYMIAANVADNLCVKNNTQNDTQNLCVQNDTQSCTQNELCVKNNTQNDTQNLCVQNDTQSCTQNELCVKNNTQNDTQNLCVQNDTQSCTQNELCVKNNTQNDTQIDTQKEVSPTPPLRRTTTTSESAHIREEDWWKVLEDMNPDWAPTYSELMSMAKQLFLTQDKAEYFWEWYSELGWVDKFERPMRNWQATMARWRTEGFKPLADKREAERNELHAKRLEMIEQRYQHQGPQVNERSGRGRSNAGVQTQDPDTPEILARSEIMRIIENSEDRSYMRMLANRAYNACGGKYEPALSLMKMALKDGNREAANVLGINLDT